MNIESKELKLPVDWWQREHVCLQLRDVFQRHMAGLHVRFRHRGEVQHELFSGFLVFHRELYMWITAAHVIQLIDTLKQDPDVTITGASLIDNGFQGDNASIPIGLDSVVMFQADPDGLDFGIIWLRPAYALPILNNPKMQFMDKEIWRNHERASPEGFYVIGFPYKWNIFQEPNGGKGLLTTGIACFPATRIGDRGEDANEGTDRFWGHPEGLYLQLEPFADTGTYCTEKIEGMSGGPVVSVERNAVGQLVYRLYGVQSAWLPQSRIARAVQIGAIVHVIDEPLPEHLD